MTDTLTIQALNGARTIAGYIPERTATIQLAKMRLLAAIEAEDIREVYAAMCGMRRLWKFNGRTGVMTDQIRVLVEDWIKNAARDFMTEVREKARAA